MTTSHPVSKKGEKMSEVRKIWPVHKGFGLESMMIGVQIPRTHVEAGGRPISGIPEVDAKQISRIPMSLGLVSLAESVCPGQKGLGGGRREGRGKGEERRREEKREERKLTAETELEIGRGRNRMYQASSEGQQQVASGPVASVRTGSHHRWMAAVNAPIPKHKSQGKHRK